EVRSVEFIGTLRVLIENQVLFGRRGPIKYVIAAGDFQNLIRGVALSTLLVALLCTLNSGKHHSVRAFVRKRRQQYVIDHAENRGGRTDPQRERSDRHGGKSSALTYCPHRIPKIEPQCFDACQ